MDNNIIDGSCNVTHSCYDCKHFKYDVQSGFIDTPCDPYCEKTHYDGIKTFPFRKTKCKQFSKRNHT